MDLLFNIKIETLVPDIILQSKSFFWIQIGVGGQAMHPLASMMMMPHMAEMMKGMAPAAPVLSQNLEF